MIEHYTALTVKFQKIAPMNGVPNILYIMEYCVQQNVNDDSEVCSSLFICTIQQIISCGGVWPGARILKYLMIHTFQARAAVMLCVGGQLSG